MTMRFAYTDVRITHPAVALGGRLARPRAVLHLAVIGPSGAVLDDCLLDTGADDTVFPESMASRLGIDLTAAPTACAAGVGGQSLPVRYAAVTLRLTDGTEFREWQTLVGFVSGLHRPLLGFAGFLQYFTATFHGDREEVELTANALLPAP